MWLTINTIENWILSFCIKVLLCGPIPNHVAIIMDGNRRYANKINMDLQSGHEKGYAKFKEILQWINRCGIKEVTVYALSTENLRRSREEVDYLLHLLRKLCDELLDKSFNQECGFRIFGDVSLLPPEFEECFREINSLGRNKNFLLCNILVAYSGQAEIAQAVRRVVTSVTSGHLLPEGITEEAIACCLYTYPSSYPDILIRTSGERRISDFLPWQLSMSFLYFTKVLWPKFSAWHFIYALYQYQRLTYTNQWRQ